MEDPPLDTNNPAVRDYLALIRHVLGQSQRLGRTGLIRSSARTDRSGIQVTGLNTPQSTGEHHGGVGM